MKSEKKTKMGCFVVWCQGGEDTRHGCSLSIGIAQQSRLPKGATVSHSFATEMPMPAMPAMQQPFPGSSLLRAEKMSHSFSAAGGMMPPGPPGSMSFMNNAAPVGAISKAVVFHADGESHMPAHTTTLLLHRLK